MTRFFYTDIYFDSAAPAVAGMKKALTESKSLDVTDIILCVPQLSSLSGTFSEAFGEDFASELLKKGSFRLKGITFYLATRKKKAPRLSKCVVFGVETKPEEMEQFDQGGNVCALIYMPLHKSELDVFKKRYPSAEYVNAQ